MENKQRFFPYAKPSLDEEDRKAIASSLSSEVITRGPLVEKFEEKIAAECNVKYAVAFSNGSSALFGAALAANISPHDTIVTSANTFIASLSMGLLRGANPLIIDVDRTNGNLSLKDLKEQLQKKKSRGRYIIVPVHFSGIAIDMQALEEEICHENVVIIEDAAHALGSLYPTGEKVGSCAYSDMTIFSFHPAKNITTGEGGIVTTNSTSLYHKLKKARDSGINRNPLEVEYPGFYEVEELSCNYNMTEFQAALGISQLKKLPLFIEKRGKLVERYRSQFEGNPLFTLFEGKESAKTAFHLFVLQIDFSKTKTTRKALMDHLKTKGIGTQVHYIPLYRHPVYKKYQPLQEKNFSLLFPEAEKYYASAITLPLYVDLSLQEVDFIAKTLKDFLDKNRPLSKRFKSEQF